MKYRIKNTNDLIEFIEITEENSAELKKQIENIRDIDITLKAGDYVMKLTDHYINGICSKEELEEYYEKVGE